MISLVHFQAKHAPGIDPRVTGSPSENAINQRERELNPFYQNCEFREPALLLQRVGIAASHQG
jgi:hypothetical protein